MRVSCTSGRGHRGCGTRNRFGQIISPPPAHDTPLIVQLGAPQTTIASVRCTLRPPRPLLRAFVLSLSTSLNIFVDCCASLCHSVYIHVCSSVHAYRCLYVHLFASVQGWTYQSTCLDTTLGIFTCVYMGRASVYVCTHKYMCVYVCVRANTCVHVCTRVYLSCLEWVMLLLLLFFRVPLRPRRVDLSPAHPSSNAHFFHTVNPNWALLHQRPPQERLMHANASCLSSNPEEK